MLNKASNFLCWLVALFLVNSFTKIVSINDTGFNKHRLENHHLRLSSSRSPLVKDKELTTVSMGIFEEIILNILADYMKFTYEIIPPSDILTLGYLQANGSWTGTTGQLQRKEVDMCVTTSAPASSKTPFQDISYPVVYVDSAILIPFPKEETKWILTSTFQKKEVWFATSSLFLFMVLSAWIIHRITISKSDRNNQNTLPFWIFYFMSIWTLSQGDTLRNRSTPFRLVCIVSFFGIFIIMNYFTASYTSVLSIPSFKATVSSIEDLANNRAFIPLIVKGSSSDEFIMASTNPTMKKIADKMKQHPERRILNAFTVDDISTIVKEEAALILVKSTAQSFIEQSYKINKNCKVTLAEKTFFSRPQTFSYPKHSPLVKSVDYNLLLMQQAGLIQYAEKRSAVPYNRCSVSEATKIAANKAVPLKLNDVAEAIAILALGFILSFILLLVECIFKKMKTI